jgi:hypothetical protein
VKETKAMKHPLSTYAQRIQRTIYLKKASFLSFVLVIGLTVVIAIGIHFRPDLVGKYLFRKSPSRILESEWDRFPLGATYLSLSCPGRLERKQLPIPDQFKSIIYSAETYEYNTRTFAVSVNAIVYKHNLLVSIETAADSMIARITDRIGATNLSCSKTPVEVSGRNALLVLAAFDGKWRQLNATGLFVSDEHRIWQVFVYYYSGDTIAERIAQKVLGSVEIEKSPPNSTRQPTCQKFKAIITHAMYSTPEPGLRKGC